MRDGADKLARSVARQLRIRIERDDVPHLREDGCCADDQRKPVALAAAQQRIQVT
jgi:hypothetical protein